MASTYLQRTNTSGTNTFTFSAWVKLCNPEKTANQWIFTSDSSGLMTRDSNTGADGGEEFHFYNSSNNTNYYSGAKRRDISGWYHIVLSSNSGTGTLYVNGETDKTGIVVPTLSTSSNAMQIGRLASNGNDNFDGLMSHVHFIDGTAYDASAFGSVDSATGEWKINTSPSVTYGSQGFFILKDGNSGTDQSGTSNNLTVGGATLTKTEDCPSNVFATGNPLMVKIGTWSNGNNSIVGSSSNGVRPQMWSTLGAKTGKFYAEAKYTDKSGGMVGVSDYSGTMEMIRGGWYQGYASNSVGFWNSGQKYIANATTSYGNAWSNNDIIQIAMDLDNMCVYFGINGTWQNSGNPASGASKTGGITIPNTRNEDYFMSWGDGSVSQSATCHVNYGNGYFGTTAVSSAGTNASNNGIFEYDVPTGYTALSTKGLNL